MAEGGGRLHQLLHGVQHKKVAPVGDTLLLRLAPGAGAGAEEVAAALE